MKKIPVILALIAVAFVAYSMSNWNKNSDNSIVASKNSTTETRKVKDFEKIEVEGVFEVDVTYGSEERVEVEAPKNLQQYIVLKVKSGTLNVGLEGKNTYNMEEGIKIHIQTAKLNGFDISGASSVKLNNTLKDNEFSLNSSGAASFKGEVDVETAKIESDGAASINLGGTASNAAIELSGASQIKDYNFEVDNLTIDLSGASSAKISSSKSINGDVSGASSLSYDGNAKVSGVSVSGAASLSKR